MSNAVGPLSIESRRAQYEAARLRLARLRVEGGSSLRHVYQESTELAATTLEVERVSIWLFIEDRTAIRCFDLYESRRGEHSEGVVLQRADFPSYFAALEEHRVIAADDARTHDATREFRAAYLEPLGIYSMLDAPIFREGLVAGVVCNETVGHVRKWTQEDSDFASSVADAVALQFEEAARRDAEAALHAHEMYVAEIQKMEALGHLAAGVAHDFRNILSVVLGHARFIEEDPEATPKIKEQVERIRMAGERGVELTKELLAFGRDEGRERPHAIRVQDAIAAFADVLRQSCGRRITIQIEPASTPGWALISPPQLERILLNLVNNARDATPSRGTITIRVSEKRVADGPGFPGIYVVIEVTDQGAGMDEETKRRIFEPFFTTKTEREGTGLGLSIVYRIVEACGGFMHVESAPGKGTTMSVYLPRVACQE
jgi:two-component system cell cycle sensor histidine kinase/response regulator CckA